METPIVDKIRKILALAARGGTEAEGNAAMAKAQELLALHNLTAEQVISSERHEDKVTEDRTATGARMNWKDYIHHAVARLYFCTAVKSGRSIVIIGKPADIAVARLIADYVIASAEKMIETLPSDRRFRNSWRVGFAGRISTRADDLIRQAKAGTVVDSSTSTELALRPMYDAAKQANDDYTRSTFGRMTTRRPSTRLSSREGYTSGTSAGNGVCLSRNTITASKPKAFLN
jgi:Protein of unknown function (DUF2786)